MNKTIIILTLVLLITGCTTPTITTGVIIGMDKNDSLINNTLIDDKPLIINTTERNTLEFKKLINGLTNELITNAVGEALVLNIDTNKEINITNNIINNNNGSYTIELPNLSKGNYLIKVKWGYNNLSSIVIKPIIIN